MCQFRLASRSVGRADGRGRLAARLRALGVPAGRANGAGRLRRAAGRRTAAAAAHAQGTLHQPLNSWKLCDLIGDIHLLMSVYPCYTSCYIKTIQWKNLLELNQIAQLCNNWTNKNISVPRGSWTRIRAYCGNDRPSLLHIGTFPRDNSWG